MTLLAAQIWFDGSCEPTNPGPGIAGAYVEVEGGKGVHLHRRLGRTTNNVAEWEALLLALEYVVQQGVTVAVVRGDSKLVVNQAQGLWRIKKAHFRPLKERADALLKRMSVVSFQWVPRELNREADLASRGHGKEF